MDSRTGKVIGHIETVDETTLNTLFEVATDDGKQLLIPAREDLIREVDTEKRIIKMEIPDGLLEL